MQKPEGRIPKAGLPTLIRISQGFGLRFRSEEIPSGGDHANGRGVIMSSALQARQATVLPPGSLAAPLFDEPRVAALPRNPIEFHLVLHFGPQLSTPCSRGLNVRSSPAPRSLPGSPHAFHRHLQHHSFSG
jgi:hypothetical protein